MRQEADDWGPALGADTDRVKVSSKPPTVSTRFIARWNEVVLPVTSQSMSHTAPRQPYRPNGKITFAVQCKSLLVHYDLDQILQWIDRFCDDVASQRVKIKGTVFNTFVREIKRYESKPTAEQYEEKVQRFMRGQQEALKREESYRD